ncbi:GxGYxYP domain-containing protein [Paenibacillus glycanilyticus]|uniref:GxGYxY sequence motif-containing protein n=1 Tax=Paenibacillus glycanilyticus TaxID=126569 RepID=A0ABQ6G587_9BACL|nr:GxGYxYP domain-containing protein [Paenibacillus glycanilyticus]GLX65712.1 hypothetical protein MU1_00560 [Paenibacillus glycanilyticus]
MKGKGKVISISLAVILVAAVSAYFAWPEKKEGISWPSKQALPSFNTPAETLDMIYTTDSYYYQAENETFGHETGKADGDGWVAAAGTDAANKAMLDVTGRKEIPAGDIKAAFNLQVDNFADEDGVVATLEVRDQTANAVLASQEVKNWDFRLPNASQSFELSFTAPGEGHELEFKVLWTGKSTVKLFDVGVFWPLRKEENLLFTSLKGIVNEKQPRIYSYTDNVRGSTGTSMLDHLGLKYTEVKDNWELVDKYRSEIKGLIIYDDQQPDTINLATTMAGLKHGIVTPPSLADKLAGEPYNLPIIEDLRGKFSSKLDVYQYLYDHYWKQTTHKAIIGLDPGIQSYLRDYAIGMDAAVVWLNPGDDSESKLLDKFFQDMPYGEGLYLGWWPDEGMGVKKTADYGLATVASDFSSNLSVLSGTSREITMPKAPEKPKLENKLYVSFILSDGDNLQYMEHSFWNLWNNPSRGEVPIGWTISPLMVDTMPGMLNYLYSQATPNDAFVSGPSGVGYTYPNFMEKEDGLQKFIERTNSYMEQSGLKVLTVWNYVKGEIKPEVGDKLAKYAPSLLGFTSQFGTGTIGVYNNSMPGQELNVAYGSAESDVTGGIADGLKNWDGKSPGFVSIQANPWQVNYQNFVNAVNMYKDNKDVVFVRPDVYFQLMRESKGLPVDPK